MDIMGVLGAGLAGEPASEFTDCYSMIMAAVQLCDALLAHTKLRPVTIQLHGFLDVAFSFIGKVFPDDHVLNLPNHLCDCQRIPKFAKASWKCWCITPARHPQLWGPQDAYQLRQAENSWTAQSAGKL